MNAHEAEGRARKVSALLSAFDAVTVLNGMVPLAGRIDAEALRRVAKPEHWAELARSARIVPPSPTTVEEILKRIERRGALRRYRP